MTDDRLVVEPAVDHDVDAAVRWYEEEQSGLGIRFARELASAYERIREHPLLYQGLG